MEKKTLLGWEQVYPIRGIGSDLLGGNRHPISEGKTYNFKFNLLGFYGELEKGIYRYGFNIDQYDLEELELVEQGVGRCYATFVIWD